MIPKKIKENVILLTSLDWDRRLFDSLIPLPDGTSYNSYLIAGSEKTALIDTTDPKFSAELIKSLESTARLDYLIANHSEQDHSGTIPLILKKYPEARLICTPKAKSMLLDLLDIPEERIQKVEDGETLSLGDKTLKFIHMPWVHWPETMVTYLEEDKMLFSCDLFGSHLATSELYVRNEAQVYEAAKRYYAEIMMPFRAMIKGHLEKLSKYDISVIAPSHGPLYNNPSFIIGAYKDWVSEAPKNIAVIPYVSMHGSTKLMVDHLADELSARGIEVYPFDLSVTDIGKLAITLVDAATIVIAAPTIHAGPHPSVLYAATLANMLRPKARYTALIGSFGWGEKQTVEKLSSAIPLIKAEMLGTVFCRGLPREKDFDALTNLAGIIAEKHASLSPG